MKNSIYKVLFLIPVLFTSGCGAKVKSYAYKQEENAKGASKGFTYSLPKTVIDVSTTITLYRQLAYDSSTGEAKKAFYTGVYDSPIVIKPRGVADPQMRFRVDPKSLRNWRVHTKKVEFKIGEDNVIQSINASFDDKTAEILENTGRTAINVGKLIAMAGASTGDKLGLVEKVSTVDVSDTFDPDTQSTKKLFPLLSLRLQSEAAANVTKELNPAETDISLVTYQPTLSFGFTNPPVPGKLKAPKYKAYSRMKSSELRDDLESHKIGKAVLRLTTFENLGKNYLEGLVTRIPAYGTASISFAPVIIKDSITAFDKYYTDDEREALKQKWGLTDPKKEVDDRTRELIETSPEEFTALMEELPNLVAALAFPSPGQQPQIRSPKEPPVILAALIEATPAASSMSVPIAQFGRLGVIPVNSNTFVDTTRNITVNSNSGSVTSFEHQTTSSGERFTRALYNISESAVQGLPGILGGKPSDAK